MEIKVLIVESNPVTRGFLSRVVRESFSDQIDLAAAADLDSAKQHIERRVAGGAPGSAFHLILIDLELPDGMGLDLLAELSRDSATKIVTTLYADDEHLFPALQAGADGYLLKEDRFEVLVEELQKIVRGQPPLSPAIARRLLSHFRSEASSDAASSPQQGEKSPALGLQKLTPRETEALTYLSKGFTIKEIASLTSINWFAVNDHIKSIYGKLLVSRKV